MTDEPTPHALGFTWELENRLAVAEDRIKELTGYETKAEAAQSQILPQIKGRLRAQQWLAKTIKQALSKDAPRGDE